MSRGYRNYALEDAEKELIAYRRMQGLKHPGETMTDRRCRRARLWRTVRQASYVLAGVALLVALWVLR